MNIVVYKRNLKTYCLCERREDGFHSNHGIISNSSKRHFDPNFLTESFGHIENGFSIIEGVLTGYRNVKHLPQLESLSKISKKLMRNT